MASEKSAFLVSPMYTREGRAAFGFDPLDGVHDDQALKGCNNCDKETTVTCTSCQTRYCSKECLKSDWPFHKALCKSLKNGFEGAQAPPNHVRAILFPMDSVVPKWIWIDLDQFDLSILRALGVSEKKPWLKARNSFEATDLNKGLKHRKIGHGLRQFTAPKVRVPGSNLNKSILGLDRPGYLHVYFGSAIFFGFRTTEFDSGPKICYEDATPRDLRMVNPGIPSMYQTRPDVLSTLATGLAGTTVGVRINCDGDMKRFGEASSYPVERYQQVIMFKKDIVPGRTSSDFAQLLDLPWAVQRCQSTTYDPLVDKDDDEVKKLLMNSNGGYLSMKLADVGKDGYVRVFRPTAPESNKAADEHTGTVIVTSLTGPVINIYHVNAFCRFMEFELSEMPVRSVDPRHGERGMFQVAKPYLELRINKQKFESYWELYKSRTFKSLALLASDVKVPLGPYADRQQGDWVGTRGEGPEGDLEAVLSKVEKALREME
ncbi:hypothetical protein GGS20DRAFT_592707 [Poronia punctata]|nr:hypothetical protein GGS20DRAFT_592707 [Poronia punctata]